MKAGFEKLKKKCLEKELMAIREEKEGRIVIDSGAADSVMPKDLLEDHFPLLPKQEGVRFLAANGQPIEAYGRMQVAFKTKGRKGINCMQFHVTNCKQPLASVGEMVDQGNSMNFIPEGSYISGPNGEVIPLAKERGVYVMDVRYLKDEQFWKGFNGQA